MHGKIGCDYTSTVLFQAFKTKSSIGHFAKFATILTVATIAPIVTIATDATVETLAFAMLEICDIRNN